MSLALRQRLVDIAVGEVGLKELPQYGPNRGPLVEKYMRSTWMPQSEIQRGFAWCMAFIDWTIQQWIKAPDVQRALALSPAMAEVWRPLTAGAFDAENWARKHGLTILPAGALARVGDLITYRFSHIGIVIADEIEGQRLKTVEGNTIGQDKVGSQREGDGVWIRSRIDDQTRSYIRLMP